MQVDGVMHSRTSDRCRPIRSNPLESKFIDLQVFRANVATLGGSSGELVEMLEHRSVEICCLLETRFRGKSVRKINGKAAQYKVLVQTIFMKKLTDV